MRTLRRLLLLGALSALVVAGFPSAGAQTPTVTSVIGSADGLFADIEVENLVNDNGTDEVAAQQVDFLTFGPEPSVTLPPTGGSVSEQVLGVDQSLELLSLTAGVLTAAAEGALGPDGFATAESTVADIELAEQVPPGTVLAQQLPGPILTAELISATCAADLDGVTGSTTLVGANILGQDSISEEPEPNTEFEVALDSFATVGVTLNRQVVNPDGSLSVTALVLEIEIDLEIATVTGTLEIGPATCGVVEGVEPAPAPAPAPAQAVPAQVRFTG